MAKDDAVESRAYERVKRLSGWKKLTFDAWDNHLHLKAARTYEDVMKLPRRVQINLANEFGMNITQQLNRLVVRSLYLYPCS